MQRFRDVTDATARRIDRRMLALAACDTLEDLEEQFLVESAKILPADCLCWNAWSTDWNQMIGCRSNEQHDRWLLMNREVFGHYIGFHPVLMKHHLSVTAQRVMRMSDCQSPSDFRLKNPFFYEVYRHLGFHYQVSYTAASLADHKILLTWSREMQDFTDRDVQVFHYMGMRLGVISRRMDERRRLADGWRRLCEVVDARLPADSVRTLGAGDVHLLSHLLKHGSRSKVSAERKIRRDTIDRQLGSIREKLGLENHQQLLSAFAELRPTTKQHAAGNGGWNG